MPPGDVAPVIMVTMLFITTGLVLILRPMSKRIGSLLEAFAEEKRQSLQPKQTLERPDVERLISAMESLDRRLNRIEERQDFTDQLLNARSSQATLPFRT